LARAERRRAAHLIAGVTLGSVRLAWLHFSRPDLPSKILQAHLAVAMHQHDQRLGVFVLHHQGLYYGVLVQAELPRRLARSAMLHIVVEMLCEADIVFTKKGGRGRFGRVFFAGHEM